MGAGRGIKPGIWYGNIFCHGVQFRGITGWRSPRIKKWKSSYINMTETPGNGPTIAEARTLKDCVFETQLHLLPDRKRVREAPTIKRLAEKDDEA